MTSARRNAVLDRLAKGRCVELGIGLSTLSEVLQDMDTQRVGATKADEHLSAARWSSLAEVVKLRRILFYKTREVRRLESEVNCAQFTVHSTLGQRISTKFKDVRGENGQYGHLLQDPELLRRNLGVEALQSKYHMMQHELITLRVQKQSLYKENAEMKASRSATLAKRDELAAEYESLKKLLAAQEVSKDRSFEKSHRDDRHRDSSRRSHELNSKRPLHSDYPTSRSERSASRGSRRSPIRDSRRSRESRDRYYEGRYEDRRDDYDRHRDDRRIERRSQERREGTWDRREDSRDRDGRSRAGTNNDHSPKSNTSRSTVSNRGRGDAHRHSDNPDKTSRDSSASVNTQARAEAAIKGAIGQSSKNRRSGDVSSSNRKRTPF